MESKELAIRLARALDAKKGYNIRILHVENLTTVTDYFVIATGNSTTHVGALADEADFQLGRAGVNVLRTEGHDGNRWVLLEPMTSMTWSTCGLTPRSCPPKSGKKSRKSRRKHGCWMAPLEGSWHPERT